MAHGRSRITQKLMATLVAVAMLLASTASFAAEGDEAAAVEEPAGPNTGKVSLTLGMDIATHYFFRGLPQENQGFIGQPYVDIGFAVYEGDGWLNSVAINVGSWNSFHSEQTFAHPAATADSWYESDLYAGVSVGIFDNWSVSLTYIALTSPAAAFGTIQELDLGIGYDDSGLWKEALDWDFALNPSVTFAFEIDGQADLSTDEGTYLQLGIEPSWTLIDSIGLSLAVPVTVGLSLDDYYQDPTSTDDDTFGFFDIGADFSLPLTFIPTDFGSWTATAGVHYIHLSNNIAEFGAPAITDGNEDFVYGKVGISLSY